MIYRVKFSDSVTIIVRAADEETARKCGQAWRLKRWRDGEGWPVDENHDETGPYLGDGAVPGLTKIVHVETRGPMEVLGIGYGEI